MKTTPCEVIHSTGGKPVSSSCQRISERAARGCIICRQLHPEFKSTMRPDPRQRRVLF